MQKDGLFYCNTITYFSKIEDEHRRDSFESVSKLKYFENVVFTPLLVSSLALSHTYQQTDSRKLNNRVT
jgi:hypothetical protein